MAPRPLLDRLLLMLILAYCVIFRKQLSARKQLLEEKQQERLASKSRAPCRRAQHQNTPLNAHMADSPSPGPRPTADSSSFCCCFLPNKRKTLPHCSRDARHYFTKSKMGPAKSGMAGNAGGQCRVSYICRAKPAELSLLSLVFSTTSDNEAWKDACLDSQGE